MCGVCVCVGGVRDPSPCGSSTSLLICTQSHACSVDTNLEVELVMLLMREVKTRELVEAFVEICLRIADAKGKCDGDL